MNKFGIIFLLLYMVSGHQLNYASENNALQRATIIALNIGESLLINNGIELLGVSSTKSHPDVSVYLAHNICYAFPLISQVCGFSAEQFAIPGPPLEINKTHVLTVLILQSIQNYMLLDSVYKNDLKNQIRRTLESTGLAAGSYVAAWAALLAYNSLYLLAQSK